MFWVVHIVSDCYVFVPGCLSLSQVQTVRMIQADPIVSVFHFVLFSLHCFWNVVLC